MSMAKIKTKDDINLVLILDDGQNTLDKFTKKKLLTLDKRNKRRNLCPPVIGVKNTAS